MSHLYKRARDRALVPVLALVVSVAMLAFVSGSAGTAAAKPGNGMPAVVAKTGEGVMKSSLIRFRSDEGSFQGRFVPTGVSLEEGELLIHGYLAGKVKENGERAQRIDQSTPGNDVAVPLTGAMAEGVTASGGKFPGTMGGGTCDILNLVLGPLDLNLLGLEIHLDTVVLDIIANPAGGLLGQLLCAVANLLSTGPLAGLLAQLIGLLEDILGALNIGA